MKSITISFLLVIVLIICLFGAFFKAQEAETELAKNKDIIADQQREINAQTAYIQDLEKKILDLECEKACGSFDECTERECEITDKYDGGHVTCKLGKPLPDGMSCKEKEFITGSSMCIGGICTPY